MSRKFDRRSLTYQMFEKLFLELPMEQYPHIIKGLTRGKAINLAQGLNSCQRFWAQMQGMPTEMLRHSAKAKQHQGEEWIVEISHSPKHTGTRSKSLWLAELLQQTKDTVRPATIPELPYEQQIKTTDEDLFASWLKKDIPQAGSGVDEPDANA